MLIADVYQNRGKNSLPKEKKNMPPLRLRYFFFKGKEDVKGQNTQWHRRIRTVVVTQILSEVWKPFFKGFLLSSTSPNSLPPLPASPRNSLTLDTSTNWLRVSPGSVCFCSKESQTETYRINQAYWGQSQGFSRRLGRGCSTLGILGVSRIITMNYVDRLNFESMLNVIVCRDVHARCPIKSISHR